MISNDVYVTTLERGIYLKHLGKYEEAKEAYIQAIHIDDTHPNGYYNLGKILYILGEYEASARAYKAAYERGMCELSSSMTTNGYNRIDSSNLFVHLGHALIDQKHIEGRYKNCIRKYQEMIDPHRVKGYVPNRGQLRRDDYNEYDRMCVRAAKEYLEGDY